MDLRCIPTNSAILRARERARAMRRYARQVTTLHYTVRSESEPGKRYHLYVTQEGITCECKGYYYHRQCKHSQRVAMRLEREGRY